MTNSTGQSDANFQTSIASIFGMDEITQMHITSLLNKHDIVCEFVGGRMYGVLVKERDADHAERLIREDLKQRRYTISFSSDGTRHDAPPEEEWERRAVKMLYKQALQKPEYAANTTLGSVLRHPRVRRFANKPFYVVCIKYLHREFVGANGLEQSGYEVEIVLSADASDIENGAFLLFQVWEEGKQILFRGGTEIG